MVDIYTLLEFEEGRERKPYSDTKGYMTDGIMSDLYDFDDEERIWIKTV